MHGMVEDSSSNYKLKYAHRPPHQIMIWVGLERYGYLEEAQRLAYRFLYMMTTAFVDFNGVVPQKVGSSILRLETIRSS